MPRICIAAILFAIPICPINAQTTQGAGVSACGEFAKRYQASPKETEDYYFSWAMVFLSGMNTSSGPETRSKD